MPDTSASDSPTPETPRATRRPDHVRAPSHWRASSPPVPQPISADDAEEVAIGPTRFGDWELKGIAIDF